MEDIEIYELAEGVLYSITTDMNESNYKKLNGKLSLFFSIEKRSSAWASSKSSINENPHHEIVFCYELVRKLYRDCEDYYMFATNAMLEEPFPSIFKMFEHGPELPGYIKKDDIIRNMFLGSLTWVYFHELGHLMQEHGYIRDKFTYIKGKENIIEDCEANGENTLYGNESAVFHVTEFAADVESIQWCMKELIRHFLPKDSQSEHDLKEFKSNLQLFICGLSCALYRFHGERPVHPTEYPEGTHPTPIRRLDTCLSNMYEKLDFNGRGVEIHRLNRKDLVHICLGSAESVGFFWLWKYSDDNKIPDNFFAGKGISFDPYKKTYWSSIIKAWDEIETEIVRVRHFGDKMGILYYTDDARLMTLS